MTSRRWPPSSTSPVVDGTFIWTASHDQWQCSLSTVSFAAAIVIGPEPRSSWSARSEARTNDLDGGENFGDQLDLPAGGCEDGAVAITEDDRTPRAAAPSFRAERRLFATAVTVGGLGNLHADHPVMHVPCSAGLGGAGDGVSCRRPGEPRVRQIRHLPGRRRVGFAW